MVLTNVFKKPFVDTLDCVSTTLAVHRAVMLVLFQFENP